MERAKVIWKPVVIPSAQEQYADLSKYFAEEGDIILADFYAELSKQ